MDSKTLGIFHLIWTFMFPLYPLIFKTNRFDIFYIYYILLLYLHWTILDGECALSLMDKRKNESYVTGSDPVNISDFYEIVPKDIYDKFMFPFLTFMWVISIILVFNRNNEIPFIMTLCLITGLIFYLTILRQGNNKIIKIYNEIFKLFLCWFISYYTIKKFHL